MPVLVNPNQDPIEAALSRFMLTEKPSMIANPNALTPDAKRSKTEQILDTAGLSKVRIAQGIVEVIEGASSDAVKLRALEVGAKMHGMLDDNKSGVTIQILNASGANLSTMLGAEVAIK